MKKRSSGMKMTLGLPAFAMAAGIFSLAGNAAAKPNIVIIMADDFGSTDVGYNTNSQPDVVTPNIDTLRSRGVSFPSAYITGNICSPSRMGLMTGRYQNRLGLISGDPTSKGGIPADYGTMASRLRSEASYRTGMAGKWHLGEDAATNGPVDRGFDEAWFFNAGGQTPYFFTTNNYPGADTNKPVFIYHNRTAVTPDNSYMTDFWTDRAIEFVNANASTNFFLYLTYNAVHADLHWPDNEFDHTHSKREMVIAMGTRMDSNIGRLMTRLDELGIRENTLIFFLSDNGGVCTGYTPDTMTSDNRPLREGKHYDYEGGIRTPFLASWPNGGIPTNATITAPVISMDIEPTALAAAGVTNPGSFTNLDGVSLLPVLTGQTNSLNPRTLFWSGGSDKADNTYDNNDEAFSAVRNKDGYKLLIHRCDMYLYNMNSDISEEIDLSANKALLIDLYRELIEWQMQMPAVKGDTGLAFDPNHPRYKDTWSFYLPMTDSSDTNSFNVLEAVQVDVAKGRTYQAHAIARYSKGNAAVPHAPQPPITWSLISTIGGSVSSNGLFTAGSTNGYVILKAQSTHNRTDTTQPKDFSSYQLIKVGEYIAPPHPEIVAAWDFATNRSGNVEGWTSLSRTMVTSGVVTAGIKIQCTGGTFTEGAYEIDTNQTFLANGTPLFTFDPANPAHDSVFEDLFGSVKTGQPSFTISQLTPGEEYRFQFIGLSYRADTQITVTQDGTAAAPIPSSQLFVAGGVVYSTHYIFTATASDTDVSFTFGGNAKGNVEQWGLAGLVVARMVSSTNEAPVFNSNPVTRSNATSGIYYDVSFNDQASDPDGDLLTFSKVSGPAWLSVTSSGRAQGTPLNSNAGTNSWTVRATDIGGLFADATLKIVVIPNGSNAAPIFAVDPIILPGANAGYAYSTSIASQASDADGDSLTFSKVSGPAWLTVSTNGTVQGTAGSGDAGTNTFTARVEDGQGGSDEASLQIVVVYTRPVITVAFQKAPGTTNYQSALTLNLSVNGSGVVTLDASSTGDAAAQTAVNAWDGPVGSVQDTNVFNTSFSMTLTASVTNASGNISLSANGGGGLGIQGQNAVRIDRPGVESLNMTVAITNAKIDFETIQWVNRANTNVSLLLTGPSASYTNRLNATTGSWDVSAADLQIGNAESLRFGNVSSANPADGYALAGFTFGLVSTVVPNAYAGWTSSHGLTGGNADQTADPDGDGAKNLYEYALGGNPTNGTDAAAIQPVARITAGGGSMEYVYNRRNDAAARGLTYALERRDDLTFGSWSNIGTTAETGYGPKNAEFDSVTNLIPTVGKTKDFIRLKITGN